MKKYMLICCCERDIEEPRFFDSHDAAHDAMVDDFFDTYGYDSEEIDNDAKEEILGDDSDISEKEAYCTNLNHDNVDWKIFEVEV